MGRSTLQVVRKPHLSPRSIRLASGTLAVAGLLAGAVSAPAAAQAAASTSCTPGALSCSAAAGTPHFPLTTKSTYQIRQLVQCGSEMYAVGKFSQIIGSNGTFSRSNAFSFSATAPFAISGWNPHASGVVNSIAVGGKNCSIAYLGGSFSSVHGTAAKNIARVSTSSGQVDTSFRHNANGQVETLLLHDGRLLAGGYFTAINGSPHKYYVGLNGSTGADDGYLQLNISGHYSFPGVSVNHSRVYNQQLSHGGHRLLAEGDFTSVGGKSRRQIFMLWLGARQATVTKWTSPEFMQNCHRTESFYVKAAAWGPTDNAVYLATTGYSPNNSPSNAPVSTRTGLCDAASKFSAANRSVSQIWINYTGCDSYYSVVAGGSTVYFGGHERWANNRDGCDHAGPGAVSAPGMVGLGEVQHQIEYNPGRSRGLGADDMILTSAGLWVASDNFNKDPAGAGNCGGRTGQAGICFLPKS